MSENHFQQYPERASESTETLPREHRDRLEYQVKTRYVNLLSIADTFIKRKASLQSTPSVKKLHLHIFDVLDTAFSYERKLIVCS